MFSTLKNVSIYSVYFNVTHGVEQIVMTAATGLESFFGNMIARGEKDKLLTTFSTVEWLVHTGVTIIFVSPKYHRVPSKKTEPTYMSPVKIFGSIKAKCECF